MIPESCKSPIEVIYLQLIELDGIVILVVVEASLIADVAFVREYSNGSLCNQTALPFFNGYIIDDVLCRYAVLQQAADNGILIGIALDIVIQLRQDCLGLSIGHDGNTQQGTSFFAGIVVDHHCGPDIIIFVQIKDIRITEKPIAVQGHIFAFFDQSGGCFPISHEISPSTFIY